MFKDSCILLSLRVLPDALFLTGVSGMLRMPLFYGLPWRCCTGWVFFMTCPDVCLVLFIIFFASFRFFLQRIHARPVV